MTVRRDRIPVFATSGLAIAAAITAPLYASRSECLMTTDCLVYQQQEPPLACNAGTFTESERRQWRQVGERLLGSARSRRDLANGYAFEFDPAPETLSDLAQFVAFESRCCPFVDFTIQVPSGARPTVFEMTGGDGVKEVLAAELGLDR